MNFSDKEKKRLKETYGPWALVTGATSGIGLELATLLAQAGFHLVLNARGPERLTTLQAEWTAHYGIQVKIVPADGATAEGVAQVLAVTPDLEVGLFVASAGFGTSGSFLATDLSSEVNMLRLNVEAVLVLTHHFSRRFARQKRGGIILLSSIVGFQGVPYSANYAATKAYVQSLAEALAEELQPNNVDVLAAAPGPVASGFEARANMVMKNALSPAAVGLPILKALGRQKTVFPGLLTKVLVYALRTVPRWGKVKIMQQVMGGMTAHQRKK